MIRAALGFFVLAVLAFVLGATGVSGLSMEIGKTLLVVFAVLAVLSFVVSLVTGRSPKQLP